MRTCVAVCVLCLTPAAPAADAYPEAEITNGLITAKFYLPDAEKGSYRGTRFDRSGIITSLKTAGHEYFGQWYPKHDPKIHDAITGPVEEFLSADGGLGYADAKPGGTFVRIGVGVVRKPETPEKEYRRFETYELVDPGKWTVRQAKADIEFTHVLTSPDGYAYEYRKRVRLANGKPQMRIQHTLRNTGQKVIDTEQYNHNFFVIDNWTVGPDTSIVFAFEPKPKAPFENGGEVRGKQIAYTRELETGQSVFSELTGYGPSASDYDIGIENRKSRAGVHIRGDQPLSKVFFWSIRTTACPEPYVRLRLQPGKQMTWNIQYDFYTRQ